MKAAARLEILSLEEARYAPFKFAGRMESVNQIPFRHDRRNSRLAPAAVVILLLLLPSAAFRPSKTTNQKPGMGAWELAL